MVIIARFIVGLREANGIIAGITKMRWLTFTVYNAIGACAWVGTWVSIGYLAGDHINTIYSVFNRFSIYVFIALVVLLAAYLVLRRRRRRPARLQRARGSSARGLRSRREEARDLGPSTWARDRTGGA